MLLRAFQLGAELVVKTRQARCEIGGGWDGGVVSKLRLKRGMEAAVREKWGLLGRRVHVVVERELSEWEVVNPIILLV